jgi:hypothetical protein
MYNLLPLLRVLVPVGLVPSALKIQPLLRPSQVREYRIRFGLRHAAVGVAP